MIKLRQKMRFYHNQLIMISSNNGKYDESTFLSQGIMCPVEKYIIVTSGT